MRILALTHQYPRLGNSRFAPYNRHQFRWLAKAHELQVVAPIAWTSRFAGGYENFLIHPTHYRNGDGIWVHHPVYRYPPRFLKHHYGDYFLASARTDFERAVKEFRPHVVLSCWAHPDGWAAVRLAREHGLPALIKVIGSDVLVLSREPRRRERIAEALREADGVAAVSRDLAERVIGLGVDPARVHVVPEGIDQELFNPGDAAEARKRLGLEASPKRLLFVGNVLVSKGAAVLLEACALLRSRGGIDFRCHLVGRGADERLLRNLRNRLGLGGVVDFAGACPQWRLPDWYRACDLVVLPSFSEGIPNVLREGMMCGRAFVATRVGGIPEITRPDVGLLVDAGDPRQLADAIAAALDEGLQADRTTALALNISWKQSADMLAEKLASLANSAATFSITESIEAERLASEVSPQPAKFPDDHLRILAVTQIFPRSSSMTAGSYNMNQFSAISSPHAVSVIAPVPWTELMFGLRREDAESPQHQAGFPIERPTFLFPPKFWRSSYGLYYFASIRKRFREVVKRFNPNMLLACWAHPDGWAAVRLGREYGLPVLIKVHGSDALLLPRHPRRRERVAEALREADGVVAVSRDLADHVVGLGIDPACVHVIPHGIDQNLFSPGDPVGARVRLCLPEGPKRILFVGNILFSKGVGVLLEACALLRAGGLGASAGNFHCHLVGRGADESRLLALRDRLGLTRVVDFAGACAQWRLPDWYRACDLVVLPSFSEGIPNVLREGMMCGRAFIASRVGGIPEITRPGVGRLVDTGDPRQLADAIAAALDSGLQADRATALELNISWQQSAQMLIDRMQMIRRGDSVSSQGSDPISR